MMTFLERGWLQGGIPIFFKDEEVNARCQRRLVLSGTEGGDYEAVMSSPSAEKLRISI
jgi:hypothetical protein